MERWRGPGITLAVILAVIVISVTQGIKLVAAMVIGLQFGAVFALVALGVALVFKATRVLNFAQGEVGTMGAWVVWLILAGFTVSDDASATGKGLGMMLLATVAAVVIGAVLSILINLVVVQRLASAKPVTTLVATAGVMIFLLAFQLIFFEAKARPFPRYIDGAPRGIDLGPVGCMAKAPQSFEVPDGACIGDLSLGGQIITWHTLLVIAVLIVAAALLAIFFRTPIGVALLATAQDPFAAEIQGVSVRSMSALAWGMAGGLAALGGILGAGVFENLSPGLITRDFLIAALVAAVLGGVTSMPGAVVGGLVLGFTVSFTNEAVLALKLELPGGPQVAAFTVLVMVLLFRPRGLFGKEA